MELGESVAGELIELLPEHVRLTMAVNGSQLCLSGAARGADALWGECAARAGHAVVHWSFVGHRLHAPDADVVLLSPQQLSSADPYLVSASEKLGRPWPPATDHAASLIRRNYFQVAWSDALYAVTELDDRGAIKGGTAWAVAMFVDRFAGKACPAYLFDQARNEWNHWDDDSWQPMRVPPPPTRIWAGIGSRQLDGTGAEAILELLSAKT